MSINKKPIKGDLKYGDHIWDGTFLDRPAVIVKEDVNLFVTNVRSPNILMLESFTEEGESVYEPWACYLEDFISFRNGELDISEIRCCEEFKKVLIDTYLVDADNQHTSDGVTILRDCIEGSGALTDANIQHGDLTIKNVVLCIIDKKVRAKLTGIRREGSTNTDYRFLEGLVKQLFSGPPGTNKMSAEVRDFWFILKKITLPNFVVDSADWKAHLNSIERAFLKDPRSLLTHPLFWTDDMSLDFVLKVRQVLWKCNDSRIRLNNTSVQYFQTKISDIGTRDWYTRLKNDTEVMKELNKANADQRGYNKTKTDHLLRFMRDMLSHIEEKDIKLQADLGDLPHGFFGFFRKRYPELILTTRRVFACYYYKHVKKSAGIKQNLVKYL